MRVVDYEIKELKDSPGTIGTSLQARVVVKDAHDLFGGMRAHYDKYVIISDKDNKASRLKFLDSLLQMLKEAQKIKNEGEM